MPGTVDDTITLTADERDAMREILSMLATIEKRGFDMYPEHPNTIIITREMWRDMLLRPAQRLRRIMLDKRLVSG